MLCFNANDFTPDEDGYQLLFMGPLPRSCTVALRACVRVEYEPVRAVIAHLSGSRMVHAATNDDWELMVKHILDCAHKSVARPEVPVIVLSPAAQYLLDVLAVSRGGVPFEDLFTEASSLPAAPNRDLSDFDGEDYFPAPEVPSSCSSDGAVCADELTLVPASDNETRKFLPYFCF